jgi:hypothetical protein
VCGGWSQHPSGHHVNVAGDIDREVPRDGTVGQLSVDADVDKVEVGKVIMCGTLEIRAWVVVIVDPYLPESESESKLLSQN